MQHETKMENQSWLKKLARRLGPGHVVNLCFIVVLLFSTLLTWREVVVLEDAYISSQRNHLENVANALDKHLQYNVDKLIFLRNGMREALVAPLDFTSLRNAVTEFEQHRDEHAWQIAMTGGMVTDHLSVTYTPIFGGFIVLIAVLFVLYIRKQEA